MTTPTAQSADTRQASLTAWLLQRGQVGEEQQQLLEGYCRLLLDLGVPLLRLHVAQSAFHPKYGGIGFDWLRNEGMSRQTYEHNPTPRDDWLKSPLYYLLSSGEGEIRERVPQDDAPARFPILNDLKALGATDYFAAAVQLEEHDPGQPVDPNNAPEGVLISWVSDARTGFSDADIDLIRAGLPALVLALKSAANRRIAEDLMQVYLGRDAGRRVLSGEIQRGSLQTIDAVLLYFDLQGFTKLSEQIPGDDLIAMLNAYFGVAVQGVHAFDGSILKFMGDGMMAMFNLNTAASSAAAGLDAVAQLRRALVELQSERAAVGLTNTGVTFALHAGEILYGNIGAENRLDFTVIGPAVNLTARLSGMHRAVGQDVIVSDAVRRAAGQTEHDLISLGRYMLRGVSEPQELFTIYGGEG
ncbi:adenylate/guanylate cyclase domain-containing protein [Ruegeria sp. 2012CJ41-6]|uniref:Adenylate/guanylate cyclase domain-containing protein n=1 Tax=Ruegeria spongiae TaxID=2942209 RepID=A0ABT0Q3R6_9RHOB|nr:adenylate/guanylate cyclase domain-containing protein [Ruegeria spongiae]